MGPQIQVSVAICTYAFFWKFCTLLSVQHEDWNFPLLLIFPSWPHTCTLDNVYFLWMHTLRCSTYHTNSEFSVDRSSCRANSAFSECPFNRMRARKKKKNPRLFLRHSFVRTFCVKLCVARFEVVL